MEGGARVELQRWREGLEWSYRGGGRGLEWSYRGGGRG